MVDLLEIRTLGPLHIQWRSSATPLVLAPRETLLLVYLAYQQLPITRQVLYDLLWPHEDRARAQGNLRKLLLDLRRSLGDLIRTDREVVTLQDSPHTIWLDVHKFKWHMTPLVHAPPRQTPQAIDIPNLIEGVKLYRGDFLADLKTPRSYHLSAWVDQEQNGLRQQMGLALRTLITHFSARGQYRHAIQYATQLLQLDTVDEVMVGETMRLWSYVGERDQALALYRTYRQSLRRAQKSVPGPVLEQLYQEIRSGTIPSPEQALLPRQPSAADKATHSELPASQQHSLPKPLTPLIGREEVMAKLHHMVHDPTVRLITLVGLGGIGKSHLALTLGNQLAEQGAFKVAFVGLERFHETLPPPALSLQPLPPTQERRQQLMRAIADLFSPAVALDEFAIGQLLAQVHQHNLLLLIDYFDPFIAEAPLLTELLQNSARLKLIVTARGALQIPGEVVLRLTGLTSPTPATSSAAASRPVHRGAPTATPAPTAAVELFLHCAKRHDPTAKPEEHLPAIAQICRLLEGHPLAIELTAGLTLHYQYTELVELLTQGIEPLSQSGHGLPRRQQSLALLLAEAWRALTVDIQQLLAALTVFEGSFSRKAAMTIAGAALEQLAMLVNQSWLLAHKAGRYRMPRLIYHYVKQHAPYTQPGAQQPLQASHADYYLSHFLEEIATNKAAAQGRVRFVFMEDEGNIVAALRWTLAHGDPHHKAACQQLLPLLQRSLLLE